MPKIAISYRREDSLDITGRIFDRLAAHYGRQSVFRDIDSMRPGIDFREHIKTALNASDVLIVVVGPKWLGSDQSGNTRIGNEADFVRFEVETALRKGIPVIPLLVGQAEMPTAGQLPPSLKDLAFRHAVTISSGKDFDHHMSVLIHDMDGLLASPDTGLATMQAVAPDPPVAAPAAAPPVPPATNAAGLEGVGKAAAATTTTAARPARSRTAIPGLRYKIFQLATAALLIASALLRTYWDLFGSGNLLSGNYDFYHDPLLLAELLLLVPASIAVAVGTVLNRNWARIWGLGVCLYALANDLYYLIFFPPSEVGWIASNALWFATTILGICFFTSAWRRASNPK